MMKIANLLLMYFLTHSIIFLESLILEFLFLAMWPVGSQLLCVHVCSVGSDFFAVPWIAVSGSSVHRIIQARILEWVAFPSPGHLLDPGIQPVFLAWQMDSLPVSHFSFVTGDQTHTHYIESVES